jgi:hypothetical protein
MINEANLTRTGYYQEAGYVLATPADAAARCPVCGDSSPAVSVRGRIECVRCGQPAADRRRQEGRDHGDVIIRIIGLLNAPAGWRDPHADRLLSAYDPRRPGVGWHPAGHFEAVHLQTTRAIKDALRFDGMLAARREWMRWDGYIRPDGRPSRPLTAYTVEFLSRRTLDSLGVAR